MKMFNEPIISRKAIYLQTKMQVKTDSKITHNKAALNNLTGFTNAYTLLPELAEAGFIDIISDTELQILNKLPYYAFMDWDIKENNKECLGAMAYYKKREDEAESVNVRAVALGLESAVQYNTLLRELAIAGYSLDDAFEEVPYVCEHKTTIAGKRGRKRKETVTETKTTETIFEETEDEEVGMSLTELALSGIFEELKRMNGGLFTEEANRAYKLLIEKR
jgi:hypothetical protein